MRSVLTICILLISFSAFTQRKLVKGQVVDEIGEGIPNVHIKNLNAGMLTTTDIDGNFRLTLQSGDSIQLTSVGYKPEILIASEEWLSEKVILVMNEDVIQLAEVSVSPIPDIDRFKEQIKAFQPPEEEQFWYFGVDKPKPREDKMLEGKHKNVLFALLQPTSFLYYNLSKKEKEKRKYYKLTNEQPTRELAFKKFTREWVQEETGLEGDQLTSFIAFCDFEIKYLAETPLFIIKENMMAKLDAFLENGKG